MKRAGIGTHRMLFHFSSLKRTRHAAYAWERFYHAVRVTARRGIR
jgi:hypothetical protein